MIGSGLDPGAVLIAVEEHLVSTFGADSGRAGVSFLGAERLDVLRFGPDPDGLVRYATVGMSPAPMTDPTDIAPDGGPRAAPVLSVRGRQDFGPGRLAVLAGTPAVAGGLLTPGPGVDL